MKMGCVNCGKTNARRAAKGETIYIKCVGCGTLLHGRKKDMKKIDGNLVCGECYQKYRRMTTKPGKKLLKDYVKNIDGKASPSEKHSKSNGKGKMG